MFAVNGKKFVTDALLRDYNYEQNDSLEYYFSVNSRGCNMVYKEKV